MLRCLQFMNAEYRAGRPEVAPRRKDNEHIVGEDMNWQITETARNELDDDETELRLIRESEQCQESLEELMNVIKVPSDRVSDVTAAGLVLPWVEQSKMKARQTKKCDADERCEVDDDDDMICSSTDDYYGGTTGPWLQHSSEQMSESSPLGKTTATQLPNTHYPTRLPTNSTSSPIPM
jgi:hypothetical protein